MPNWKKVVTSGSDAHISKLTISEDIIQTGVPTGGSYISASQGNFELSGSGTAELVVNGYITSSAISASGTITANTINVNSFNPTNLSASGVLHGSASIVPGLTKLVAYNEANGAFHITASSGFHAAGGGGGGSMSDFTLTADGGSNQTIADGNTLDIAGGNGITTAVGATDTVTVNLDNSLTNVTTMTNSSLQLLQDANCGVDLRESDVIKLTTEGAPKLIVSGSSTDSGSLFLSSSIEMNANNLKPQQSASRMYKYSGNPHLSPRLEYGGVPFGGTQFEQIHSNFIDDLNTSKVYIPFRDVFESTLAYDDNITRLAPCSGSLVQIAFKLGNTGTSGGELTFTLEKVSPSSLTSFSIVDSQSITVPSGTTDYHVYFVNFDVDAVVAPGDAYAIGVQSDTDLSGNTYWYANLVFQWDYTSLLPSGTEKG